MVEILRPWAHVCVGLRSHPPWGSRVKTSPVRVKDKSFFGNCVCMYDVDEEISGK